MKVRIRKRLLLPVIAVLTLALIVGGMFAVNASERSAKAGQSMPTAADDSAVLGEKIYNATHSRSRWLYDLLTVSGTAFNLTNRPETLLEVARERGIVDFDNIEAMYEPLDRAFVASSMVKALGYPHRSAGYISDTDDADMAMMAYYGYFLPDLNYQMFPEALITPGEYDALLGELSRYRLLKGKKILSFGDSIMYGEGNSGEGISDMIAEKYGMTCSDYSVSGAAMGTPADRGHILNQLKRAAAKKETADVILLNGGTNDVNHSVFGILSDGFDLSTSEEITYTGGFEKTLWTLRTEWAGTPVIYVRAHNMKLGDEKKEEHYGNRAEEITEKWGVPCVDLYHQSGMNTEDPAISSRYTMISPSKTMTCDTIHPTAVGYAKFYLPPVSEEIAAIFEK